MTSDVLAAMARPAPFFGDNLTATLIADLAEKGWAHVRHAVPDDLANALRARLIALDAADALKLAAIGRGESQMKATAIRKTRIRWLDGSDPAEQQFLEGCEALRRAINEALFAGLFEFEAHFAHYPQGGHYARHLDAFADKPRDRVISLVVWLNEDWQAGDGGELDLWTRPEDIDPPIATLVPLGGDLVLMLSERIPHAVRETFAPRLGLAGWFRINPGIAGVLDPAV